MSSLPEPNPAPLPKPINIAIERFGMRPRKGVAAIIDKYAARIRSVANCADQQIKLALEASHGWAAEAPNRISSHVVGFRENVVVVRNLFHDEITDHMLVPPHIILAQALLGAGFSAFDAFLGQFLSLLYREQRSVLGRFELRQVTVGDIVSCATIDEALDAVVEKNLSKELRESYDTIFATLAKWHGLSTLTDFPAWAEFVEASQRRHLFMHCDGIVNAQYMKECKSAGCNLAPETKTGTELKVDLTYLKKALDVLYQVTIMLGVTLWRTASKDCIEPAEEFITDEIFVLLDRGEWPLAIKLGFFAINLPEQKSDLQSKITRINYSQALKWSGDQAGAISALAEVDWSSCSTDLKLAVAVGRDEYDTAEALMRQRGKETENKASLQVSFRFWPIYREFRKSPQFRAAFQEIFGVEFAE